MDRKCCTFFGHRDCPSDIRESLRKVILTLVEDQNVEFFYVGNHGQFDAMVRSVLRELRMRYPGKLEYAVVLAYLPQNSPDEYDDVSDTMLPEGIEAVPKRFAVSWRNQWMLDHSDYVVTYITHTWGGAAQFAEKAVRKKKMVIRIPDK